VTTEYNQVSQHAKNFVNALIESDENYIVIYPNNDLGSSEILSEYVRLTESEKIKIFPSLRFEYFLALLKGANYIVGNSSAGVREAPYYNTPTVDIGSRQNNRASGNSIFHSQNDCDSILKSIQFAKAFKADACDKRSDFGKGGSDKAFLNLLNSNKIWSTKHQKQFQDIDYE